MVNRICHMSPVLLFDGSSSNSTLLCFPFSSMGKSSTRVTTVACRAKTEKFVPSCSCVTPPGKGKPFFMIITVVSLDIRIIIITV